MDAHPTATYILRQLNQDVTRQTGKEFGADGVELSAHALCAEDHLPYQGRQFSNKEFEQLQATLARPIGQWNCKHFAHPILLGISRPAYTQAQLDGFKQSSGERIEIDGVSRTHYQWSQEQRRIETAIRRQKDTANLAKASGDDPLRRNCQAGIEELQKAYRRISERAGLNERWDKTRVDGFKAVKPLDAEATKLIGLEQRRMARLKNDPSLALPLADKATAAEAKFTKYLFNPNKPEGYAKGVAFESRLGYNKDNWEKLQAEILDAAKRFPARLRDRTEYGNNYEQIVVLRGQKGTPANVILGWTVDEDSAHLVTAIVKEVGRGKD